ncbi:flagella synthesis protein FlgN [Paludibacterium yongneupense]|uniref:flagella synthesis protein FlgN n=1 Tax=Paludibacterium yongneupense TaxID=400061 RepID=UPI0003FFC480|nr:flagellar protein FlgN [Paludibacterium yongneupense]
MSDIDTLEQACREETAGLSRLLALLQEEQTLLIAGRLDGLETLAQQKKGVLAELEPLGRLRAEWLQRAGVDNRPSLLLLLADHPAAAAAWLELESVLGQAQAVNRLNGGFIDDRLKNTELALTTLTTAAASTLAYGRDGSRPTVPVGGRHLGSA